MTSTDSIRVTCDVSNTGTHEGKEIVQLYIQDVVGSVTRPVRELKGFEKIMLQAGERKTVSFTVSVNDLSFYKNDVSYGAEPGDFKAFVGGNSQTKNEASFSLQ